MIDPKYVNAEGHLSWYFFAKEGQVDFDADWEALYAERMWKYLPYAVAIPDAISPIKATGCWHGEPSGAWRIWRHDEVTYIHTETEEDAIILRLAVASGDA
jgi:hypothetical protein